MTGIQPELWVDRAGEAVAFYEAAFGARVLLRVGEGDDIVAQLAVDDAVFWVSSASDGGPRFSPIGASAGRPAGRCSSSTIPMRSRRGRSPPARPSSRRWATSTDGASGGSRTPSGTSGRSVAAQRVTGRSMRTCVRMTAKGSSYAWFRRCLARGDLAGVRAAAVELPVVDLTDALRICVLMAQQGDRRFERAAVRWLARLCVERRPTLDDLRAGPHRAGGAPAEPGGRQAGALEPLRAAGVVWPIGRDWMHRREWRSARAPPAWRCQCRVAHRG